MDAKDILGLPKTSPFAAAPEKKQRPARETQRKPDGVSREVYALTGGIPPPLVSTIEASHLKRRPPVEKEKITWQWLPFTSSARSDNLQLHHWVRVVNGVPSAGDYPFAKYNKSVDIPKYTDEEYAKHLTDPLWTKEETDQLFDLCGRFDLRFIVIADRFPTPRSIEDLKSRYYTVARKLLISRAPSFDAVAGHPLVKDNFDSAHEIERKRALSAVLSQTKLQERKDAEIMAEAKQILESRMASKSIDEFGVNVDIGTGEKAITSVDATLLENAHEPTAAPVAAMTDSTSIPASLRMLRVYLRTHALDQMVQATTSTAGLRTIKRVEQTLQDLGVLVKPKVPTKAVCAEHLELRKEILTLLNLQKQLQNKDTEASGNRENSFSEAPSTPKYSNRDIDRPFVPDSLGYAVNAERVGKKDHKRKRT